ncbi:MAG: ribulose-phosphate 3-epimerase [Candidatus Micrarchaeota archaeon]|nr:ribulose-phosphate 3-epimerase [Candidatus Micrarchaeota archaeon]
MDVEVIPAILVKNREDLLERINRVRDNVATVHIDVMDNEFVPNKTVGPESFEDLPAGIGYEFHWMVRNPEKYIERTRGKHLHVVHVETISGKNWNAVKKAVRESGGKLGIAINPATTLKELEPYLNDVSMVLVMSVVPGFDGQKYIGEVEGKIRELRRRFPELHIEVDGGINEETAAKAGAAGADKLAASSSIYRAENAKLAIKAIREAAMRKRKAGVGESKSGGSKT